MNRVLIGLITFISLFVSIVTVQAEEVLMVRWIVNADVDNLFMKKLKEVRPNVKFTYLDADRNKSTLVKKLQSADFSKYDLVYSFGTTTTKIVRSYLKGKKPLIFNAVSAPVLSKIANSVEKPGHNLTGAKMLIDLEMQVEVLLAMKDIKKLGLWFDPRERQSQAILLKFKKIAKKRDINLHLFRVIPDANQFDKLVNDATKRSNKLDAVYFIPSASLHPHYSKISSKLDPSLLTMGALIDYVQVGLVAALAPTTDERAQAVVDMAVKILDGANAGEIPISLVTKKNAALYVNKNKMGSLDAVKLKALGLKVIPMEGKK